MKPSSRQLIRSGEPLNTSGHPFGGAVRALAIAPLSDQRIVLVAGHNEGFSTVELVLEARGGWHHAVTGERNRWWRGPIPVDGARLTEDGKLQRTQFLDPETGAVVCCVPTPWNTVLCGEEWVIEYDPRTAVAIKRFSLGRCRPAALKLHAESGHPIEVEIESQDGSRHSFVSHQRFDSRHLSANSQLLAMGKLETVTGTITDSEAVNRLKLAVTRIQHAGFGFEARPCDDGGSAIWVSSPSS